MKIKCEGCGSHVHIVDHQAYCERCQEKQQLAANTATQLGHRVLGVKIINGEPTVHVQSPPVEIENTDFGWGFYFGEPTLTGDQNTLE